MGQRKTERDRKTERKRGAMLRVSEAGWGGGGDKNREKGRERGREGGTDGVRWHRCKERQGEGDREK